MDGTKSPDAPSVDGNKQERTVPVVEEELVTGTRPVKTGTVRIRKQVQLVRKSVEMPAIRDVVKVSRVAVNKIVQTMPQTREEGDLVIVPVVEEQIVVKRRLVLKEEIHIVRQRARERVRKAVTLGREHATIDRLDGDGAIIETSQPPRRETKPGNFKRHKSLLE
jgi:uncharacterized protein (TIGR02271 family)